MNNTLSSFLCQDELLFPDPWIHDAKIVWTHRSRQAFS